MEASTAAWHRPGAARANNFDALRLAMAMLVIFAHSFPLLRTGDGTEPLYLRTGGASTFGGLAVDVFFIISGYLVTMSWERSKSAWQYLRKRVDRIYPGFIVVTILCAVVVAPLTVTPGAHWITPRNLGRFIASCVGLREFVVPGVLANNPTPEHMYGSVWTIGYEFRCYLLTVALGIIPLLKRRWFFLALWIAAVFVYVSGVSRDYPGYLSNAIFLPGPPWPRFAAYYLTGCVFFAFRGFIPTSGLLALTCVVLLGALHWTWQYRLLMPTCGAYLLFWIAFQPYAKLHNFARCGDFSYGVYLYAFPIQQLLVFYLGTSMPPWELFLIAAPLSLIAGVLSWHLVEKRFLVRSKPPKPPGNSVEGNDVGKNEGRDPMLAQSGARGH